MFVRDILSALRRRWLILAVCSILGLLIAGASATLATPAYTSTARLLVATPHIDQSAQVPPGGISTTQRAINYASLVTGTTIAQQVIDQLHLTDPLPVLQQRTHVTVLSGTTIIEIAVDDSDAAQAQRIAQAFAVDLAAYVPKVEDQSGAQDGTATVTITDNANLPTLPTTSGIASTLALGLVAGVVVGAAVIWMIEFLDTRIRRPQRLAELAGTPVLGSIIDDSPSAAPLISSAAPHGPHVESYRTLRTALQFVDIDAGSPVFCVVGPRAGVGTSTAAVNIATSMAWAGQRTLLIDADLHAPSIAPLVGLSPSAPGLTEVLDGSMEVTDVIQRWQQGGIDVVLAGQPPALPTEKVQSKAMDDLLAKLRDRYDVIILDTPPLRAVSDAALLASASDGAILVARYGRTRAEDVTACVESLSMVRARLLGPVLLGIPTAHRSRSERTAAVTA